MTLPTKLIFLPGAGGNPSFWKPVSDLLTCNAQRCLVGWPGFGIVPSNPDVNGLKDLVDLIISEIDQPTALIAQSMGGIIAMQAALARSSHVTHIVLCVTSGGVNMSDILAEDWRPEFLRNNPTIPRWFTDYQEDISSSLSNILAPTLLLWGDADPISPVAVGHRLEGLLPNRRMEVIKGGKHDLANKLATKVAPLIDEHLVCRSENTAEI